jgi:uncharacterized membrane protein
MVPVSGNGARFARRLQAVFWRQFFSMRPECLRDRQAAPLSRAARDRCGAARRGRRRLALWSTRLFLRGPALFRRSMFRASAIVIVAARKGLPRRNDMSRYNPSYGGLPVPLDEAGVPRVRQIGTKAVWHALALGWRDFRENPTQLVFLAIIYPVIGLVAAGFASGRDMMPIVWPMLSGFALVGPLAALGVYEISRRRERGKAASWVNAFDVRHSPALPSILALGVLLLAVFVAWLFTARAIYDATFAAMPAAAGPGEFLRQVLRTPEGWRLMLLGNGTGLLFAAVVLTLTVVSFPLLLDRPVGAAAAMRTSLRAVVLNPGPMLLWGALVAGILAVASIPLFVGLAVAVPVLGHATWHLYRAVVPR